MDGLIAFIAASLISFWGSLQLGLVNVAVIQTTINKGGKQAFFLALGGVLPEIPYTLIAIYGTEFIDGLKSYKTAIGIAVGVIMLGIGFYYYFVSANAKPKENINTKPSKTGSFFKGFLLASLNPQLIFFWSGILILLKTDSLNFLPQRSQMINFDAAGWISPKFSFAFGAAFGALIILSVYIYLARRYRNKISTELGSKLNRIVGLFFILVGLFSILRNVI
ncbi:LysE family transporter [bacterium]|nr:LysE family transporter [bacterium]